MSDQLLIVAIAAITYLSRAAAVVLLPPARGGVLQFVRRIPAPLFASLAVFAVLGDEVIIPEPSTIGAVVAALLVTPRKSLGVTLAAGLIGFVVVGLLV